LWFHESNSRLPTVIKRSDARAWLKGQRAYTESSTTASRVNRTRGREGQRLPQGSIRKVGPPWWSGHRSVYDTKVLSCCCMPNSSRQPRAKHATCRSRDLARIITI